LPRISGRFGTLTLNLEVRFENEKIPSFSTPDIRKVGLEFRPSPTRSRARWAAASDLVRQRLSERLFGSYGRYYDWTKYEARPRARSAANIW
jgi:hypothetical protein